MIVAIIKELCNKENITFAQLEKELSFGNGTIRRWDDNPPSITKVTAVAKRFGVTVDYLVTDRELEN